MVNKKKSLKLRGSVCTHQILLLGTPLHKRLSPIEYTCTFLHYENYIFLVVFLSELRIIMFVCTLFRWSCQAF